MACPPRPKHLATGMGQSRVSRDEDRGREPVG
jgi:hypothetical protein